MISIGNRREFFWDDFLTDDEKTTARRKLHSPVRKGVVLTLNKPWEGDGCNYFNISHDEEAGLYRLYYNAFEMLSPDRKAHKLAVSIACIESRDGIHWERPSLGLREFDGSMDNNIVLDNAMFPGMAGIDNFFVFVDANPAPAVPGRFKAVMQHTARCAGGSLHYRLLSYTSDDGYSFRYVGMVTEKGFFDTLNTAHYSEALGGYICYIRSFHAPGARDDSECNANADLGSFVRDIRVLFSNDFLTWTEPRHLNYNDDEDFPLYTNCIYPYPGGEHMLVGLPSRYIERPSWTPSFERLCGLEKRRERSAISRRYGLTVTDCVFMCSRDGINWYRYGDAFMRPGPEQANNWVYGDCYPSVGLIPTHADIKGADDELSFYTFENHWMSVPANIARYAIRRDGFISMNAGLRPEKVVTKPFTFEGNTLRINFSTSARGSVYITVRPEGGGNALISGELFGDKVDRVVDFNGDLKALSGKPVRIEMGLCDADVYAFQFGS